MITVADNCYGLLIADVNNFKICANCRYFMRGCIETQCIKNGYEGHAEPEDTDCENFRFSTEAEVFLRNLVG